MFEKVLNRNAKHTESNKKKNVPKWAKQSIFYFKPNTSQSNALHYNYLKGFRTLFISNIMKRHDIQTIPSKTLKPPWPSGKTTILVNQRSWI